MNLARKHRPQTFDQVTGQGLTAIALQRMVERGKVPDALLLSGPSGTGKTTVARVIAQALDADTVEVDGASRGGVAEVRALIETMRYGYAGAHRVVIVDEAQSITKDGFNAFLKTLEEPPSGTIFIFCTTEPEKIPETVMTRVIEFEFRRVTPYDITQRLLQITEAEAFTVDPDLIAAIADRADGSVRSAIMLLEQVNISEVTTLQEFYTLQGYRDSSPYILAAMIQGNREKAFRTLDRELEYIGSPKVAIAQLIRLFRDITVLHGGGTLHLSGPDLQHRIKLAARTAPDDIYALSRILWTLKTRVRIDDDPRGNLELAVMLMLDTLTRAADRSKVEAPPAAEKLTLAEMQRRALK